MCRLHCIPMLRVTGRYSLGVPALLHTDAEVTGRYSLGVAALLHVDAEVGKPGKPICDGYFIIVASFLASNTSTSSLR